MKAILTDITRCIGCLECVEACKAANNLAMDTPRDWQKNDGLSALNWTSIIRKPNNHFIRKHCRHCLEPACVASCPVGALQKTKSGAVIYDNGRCLGCRYCMVACPYGIPRYDWAQTVPYVRKCTMCFERIMNDQQPACTSVCPVKATIFGERDELLKIAHDRIEQAPELYIQKVYGEHEIGGTCVLYISDIDLGFLAYKTDLGNKPLPQATAPAMRAVPFAFVGMGALMYGLSWIIGRRIELKDKKKNGKSGNHE